MNITVQIKTVYGIDKIYPVCEKAKIFASLISCKTLTEAAIRDIKALGYTITVESTNQPTL